MKALARDTEVLARETEVREAVEEMIKAEEAGERAKDRTVNVKTPDGKSITVYIRRVGPT